MLGICNSNPQRLDASIMRGRVSIDVMGILLFMMKCWGLLGDGADMVGYLLVVMVVMLVIFFGTR